MEQESSVVMICKEFQKHVEMRSYRNTGTKDTGCFRGLTRGSKLTEVRSTSFCRFKWHYLLFLCELFFGNYSLQAPQHVLIFAFSLMLGCTKNCVFCKTWGW